jgi:hypothetical protein
MIGTWRRILADKNEAVFHAPEHVKGGAWRRREAALPLTASGARKQWQ